MVDPHRTEIAPAIAEFMGRLVSIPWFNEVGRPIRAGFDIEPIGSWDRWPGPVDPGVARLADRHQALYDNLMEDAGEAREALAGPWSRIQTLVVREASARVPYDPDGDAWHAPTTAVWFAAWTAGLVGLCLATGRPIPADIAEQWRWYMDGRWPCGFAYVADDDEPGPLLIY